MSSSGGARRSNATGRHRGGGRGKGHVQEDGALTLDAWVCSEKTEEVGIIDDLARSAAAGEEEDDVELVNGGAPARFLRQ